MRKPTHRTILVLGPQIRRQIQLSSTVRVGVGAALQQTLREEGVAGLYRGFVPNALKNLPNKGGNPSGRATIIYAVRYGWWGCAG
jgi:Mitochondrial carrier protein